MSNFNFSATSYLVKPDNHCRKIEKLFFIPPIELQEPLIIQPFRCMVSSLPQSSHQFYQQEKSQGPGGLCLLKRWEDYPQLDSNISKSSHSQYKKNIEISKFELSLKQDSALSLIVLRPNFIYVREVNDQRTIPSSFTPVEPAIQNLNLISKRLFRSCLSLKMGLFYPKC